MTKKWLTTRSDRNSAKYKALHKTLRDEIKRRDALRSEMSGITDIMRGSSEPEPTKTARKRAASNAFRARGGE